MRLWLDPNKLAARSLTAGDVVNALREQNVQVAAGSIGDAPARKGQTYQISVRAAGRLREVRDFENIIVKAGETGGLVRLARRRPRRAGRRDLRLAAAVPGLRRRRLRRLAAADRERARRRARRPRRARSAGDALPARHEVPRRLQHDPGRGRVDPRSADHAGRSDRPGRPRHVPVPPELAHDDHPDHHHPGVAHRRVRVRQADGLLHQHADAVRHHPRHRHRRGRRDRGDREHRAAHRGVRQVGGAGGVRRDEGGVRRGHRDGAGADRRVRAGGVLPGHDRPALLAVLDHDRVLGGAVRLQRRDVDAGAVRAAARPLPSRKERVLPWRRAGDLGRHQCLHRHAGPVDAREDRRDRAVLRRPCGHLPDVPDRAAGADSGRGSRLLHHRRPGALRGLARVHRHDRAPGRADPDEGSRRPGRVLGHGLQLQRLGAEPGPDLLVA